MSDEYELSEAAREQIAEAVKILRDDGVHVHKTYARFQASLGKPEGEPGDDGNSEPGEGDPPPVKDVKPEPKVEIGLWGKKRAK